MSKFHHYLQVNQSGTQNVVNWQGYEYIVLNSNLSVGSYAFFLLGIYNGNLRYALNAELHEMKRQMESCPAPNNSGTQTDDRPPIPPVSPTINEYSFVIKCTDNEGLPSELFLIEANTRAEVNVWNSFKWNPRNVNNNIIQKIRKTSIKRNAWKRYP